jgi:hypothetical protein
MLRLTILLMLVVLLLTACGAPAIITPAPTPTALPGGCAAKLNHTTRPMDAYPDGEPLQGALETLYPGTKLLIYPTTQQRPSGQLIWVQAALSGYRNQLVWILLRDDAGHWAALFDDNLCWYLDSPTPAAAPLFSIGAESTACIPVEICTAPLSVREITPAATIVVIVTATPTSTPTLTPFPTPTPETFATGVTNTRLNMRDAPGLVDTAVITTLPAGEPLLIDLLTLRFNIHGDLPFGPYLWAYVHSQHYSGWVALAEMDGYASKNWYVDTDTVVYPSLTPGAVEEFGG